MAGSASPSGPQTVLLLSSIAPTHCLAAYLRARSLFPLSGDSRKQRIIQGCLTFTMVSSKSTVVVSAVRVNTGTTLFCDGQASTRLSNGDRIIIRRSTYDVRLVENPEAREWRSLAEKLNWAASPRYTDEDAAGAAHS